MQGSDSAFDLSGGSGVQSWSVDAATFVAANTQQALLASANTIGIQATVTVVLGVKVHASIGPDGPTSGVTVADEFDIIIPANVAPIVIRSHRPFTSVFFKNCNAALASGLFVTAYMS